MKSKRGFLSIILALSVLLGQHVYLSSVQAAGGLQTGATAGQSVAVTTVGDGTSGSESGTTAVTTTADGESGTTADGEPVETTESTPTPNYGAGSAKLRVMYTTDTHGMVKSYDYQKLTETNNGLDRVYTLMKRARAEMPGENYLTFDIGDNIMNFTTDYITEQDYSAVQPIFTAMSLMQYDALTLGNHEFDYGLDYIMPQLTGSGLIKKCVLSNVVSAVTGEHVLGDENRIIEKQVVDNDGHTRVVKVGIFGVVTPSLSSRTENVKKDLSTTGIVDTARAEVEKLRAQGADIVIALAHSGMGTQEPKTNDNNALYGMTSIDGLDLILGGHIHTYFPAESRDSYFYTMPGIDYDTGLVNGKRVMILRDSARSLGLVDLKLSFDSEGQVHMDGSDYEIRKTTSKVEPDETIAATMDEWGEKLIRYSGTDIGSLGEDRWNMYTGAIENNPIMQTIQNAQRRYAYQYLSANAEAYLKYPIITASRYGAFGVSRGGSYGDLSGMLRNAQLTDFADYHKTINLYQITGAQLREWVEWTASQYQTLGTSAWSIWDDPLLESYVRSWHGESLLTDQSVSNWQYMFFFGGIEYTINPMIMPRYDFDGIKINDTRRVTSLTIDGREITDDEMFVIASDQIMNNGTNTEATKGIIKQRIVKSDGLTQDYIREYLQERAVAGNISINVDKSWKLDLPEGYSFAMVTGSGSAEVMPNSKWFSYNLGTQGDFTYYECTTPAKPVADTEGPGILLVTDTSEAVSTSVKVMAMVHDESRTIYKKYLPGDVPVDDPMWTETVTGAAATGEIVEYPVVPAMTGDTFSVSKNGTYTVFAMDYYGNASAQSITVTNIAPDTLRKPTVDTVDNNDEYVSGTAQAGTTINIVIGSKTYKGKVSAGGDYEVEIPVQKARQKITAYVTDSKGRKSASVSVYVKRVCPNQPSGEAKNNSDILKGKLNDTSVKPYVVIGDKVYVSKSWGTSYYKNCKKYDPFMDIVKTDLSVSGGSFSIKVPAQASGTEIKIFNVDTLGRVCPAQYVTVKKVAPEMVKIYDAFSCEKYVYGYVPDHKKCFITVMQDGDRYTGYSDSKGYFSIRTGKLHDGDEISVYAAYKRTSSQRSYVRTATVDDIYDLYDKGQLTVNKITAADKEVKGTAAGKGRYITVVYNDTSVRGRSGTGGKFTIETDETIPKGDKVYVLARNSKGQYKGTKIRKVVEAPPSKPVVEDVTEDEVTVLTKKSVKVTLRVADVVYDTDVVEYDEKLGRYRYTFKINSPAVGDKIVARAKNEGGTTKSKVYVVER